jgi:hypothetical protein
MAKAYGELNPANSDQAAGLCRIPLSPGHLCSIEFHPAYLFNISTDFLGGFPSSPNLSVTQRCD